MKHLFFVHSHITFIVSNKVIKFLELSKEDCIFIIHRGKISDYKSLGIKMVEFPFNSKSNDSFPLFNKFWKSWMILKELDGFIDNATQNDEFIFYTPQTYQKYLALINSYKRCVGFNILEEGLASYLDKKILHHSYPNKVHYPVHKKILWKLNFFNRLKINRSFVEDGYNQAFGLTPYSFKELERRIILGLPSPNDYDFEIEAKEEGEDYKNILVFDALVEANIIDSGALVMSTLILLNKLIKKGTRVLHVKYHPDQLKADTTIRQIKELFNQMEEIKIIEISPNVALEEIALKHSATFFVFASSVGLYASFYGREVYSLAKLIERFNPQFSKRINVLPGFYKEKLNFI